MTEDKAGTGTPKVVRRLRGASAWKYLLSRAENDMEHGRLPSALAKVRKVLAQQPNHLGALELRARVEWRSGSYEMALDTLRHLIRLNPYEPGYHLMSGGAHQALGHYGEAVRAYSRCLEAEVESVRAAAAVAIRELDSWQEGVIADLLRTDRSFQTAYARDPLEACRERGFEFGSASSAVAASVSGVEQPLVWERPS